MLFFVTKYLSLFRYCRITDCKVCGTHFTFRRISHILFLYHSCTKIFFPTLVEKRQGGEKRKRGEEMFFAPLEIATQALLARWRRRCGICRKVFQKLVGSYHSSQKARNSEDSRWDGGNRIDEPDTRKFHRSRFTNPRDKMGWESSFKNGAGPEESEALTKRKHKGQPTVVKERCRKYEKGRKDQEIFRHGSEQKRMGRDIWDSGQV